MSTNNEIDSPSAQASIHQKRRHQVTPPTECHSVFNNDTLLSDPTESLNNNHEVSSSEISLFNYDHEDTIINSPDYRCLFSWFHHKCFINAQDSKSITMNFLLKYKKI
jgi:hypothetical protein